MTSSGKACLADFGLASAVDSQAMRWSSLLTASPMGGTARWQAPELLDYLSDDVDDKGQNTMASDIYSFACVCYEVCSYTLLVFYSDPFPDILRAYTIRRRRRK